jgi:hypothetical protein
MSALFGTADMDTGVLAEAATITAGDGNARRRDVAAALDDDPGAAGRLGMAGVVAVQAAGGAWYERRETLHGWELVAEAGTPAVADLAKAAAALAGTAGRQARGPALSVPDPGPDLGRDRTTAALGRRYWSFFADDGGEARVGREEAEAPWESRAKWSPMTATTAPWGSPIGVSSVLG